MSFFPRILLVAVVCANAALAGADVLFPAPLHITRELTNPITGSKVVVDDYCHGNRVVSVNGHQTAIAEYDKNVLTTIDFDRGTYSVTKFDDLAKAWDNAPVQRRAAASSDALRDEPRWRVEQKGSRVVASRPGESFEARLEDPSGTQLVQLTADTQLRLSRAAAEVLLGIAYPNRPDPAAEVLLGALRSRQPRVASNADIASADYHVPLEQIVRHEVDGESIEVRNVVLRIGNELPPSDVLTVPIGAKLVESDAVAARRMLDELDGVRPAQR